MRVTFHGVRGSTPCQSDDIRRYGGNTSCVSVDAPGEDPLLLDMGTGLRYYGKQVPPDTLFRGNCLLTHLHWDHVQGLPFFAPLLREGSTLNVYGPTQDDGRTLEEVVSCTIRPPLFPVSVDELPGVVTFHDTADDDFTVGSYNVKSRLVPHLGPTLGFRVELDGHSVAYMSDHQQPFDGSYSASAGALELIEGADLLIHDAQYTKSEFAAKSTWGHCTIDYAVWLAAEAGVRRLALFHHDPARRDDDLDALLGCAVEAGALRGVDVIAASEGLVVDVAQRGQVIVVASLILGVVFVVSGVTKVAAPAQWRSQSGDLGVPAAVATVVPFVELAVGALLIAQLARTFAAILAGLLLVAFTLLLIVRLAQGRRPPCACFGALTSKPIGWRNVVRNVVFLALAAIVAAG